MVGVAPETTPACKWVDQVISPSGESGVEVRGACPIRGNQQPDPRIG